jgi:hypothetical protein
MTISIEQQHANALHLLNSDLYVARRAAAARGQGPSAIRRTWTALVPKGTRFGEFTREQMLSITQAFKSLPALPPKPFKIKAEA